MNGRFSEVGSQRAVSHIDQTFFNARRNWIDFWFAPADPAPLALIRILLGGMLVYSHLVWGLDLPAFLGADGWNSAELIREMQKNQWNWSFWWYVPEHSMPMVHRWCIGILIFFWAGCFTRITAVLAFLIHISYCQRAAMANFGLDQIAGILLMYLMIGPCGAAYSVDSLWNWFRTKRPMSTEVPPPLETRVEKSASAKLALRLIQVHYCVIYFFAGTGKLQGESWWTGEALWRAFANYEYQSTDMTWLAWYPDLLQLVTHVAIIWELSFAYLIWVRPLRPLMLAIGVLVHVGIGAFLGMWTFGLTMTFGYIVFLQPETVRALMHWPFTLLKKAPTSSAEIGIPTIDYQI